MVEFGSGPVKEHIDNTVFIIPGIIIVVLVGKTVLWGDRLPSICWCAEPLFGTSVCVKSKGMKVNYLIYCHIL